MLSDFLAKKLDTAPASPGVYLMKSKAGEIFYIGKAKNLRDRLRSYFSGADTRAFVALLDGLLDDLEFVLTNTEKEALILENELIKEHQPRFNVKLTDDKQFLCLRLNADEVYPRLEVVRRFARDGARYFGPYDSASSLRFSLRMINRHFQLRTCSDEVLRSRKRPCLQYQIKRCPAPCVFDLTDSYSSNVGDVVSFLEGRSAELLDSLQSRMEEHAEKLEFEAAATLRDQARAVGRSLERQRVVSDDFINRDVIGLYREGPSIELHIMRTRHGRLMDARRYSLKDTELATGDVLAEFATQYYQGAFQAPGAGASIPQEIIFPVEMQWSAALTQVWSEQAGKRVHVLVPQRGEKLRLLELAQRNAHQAFVDKEREEGAAKTAVEQLQRSLRLRLPPQCIECFDISHFGGTGIVASAVRLEGGIPDKSRYRRYNIKTTQDQDDYKSMYEVLSRRARRALEEDDLPDLIVIDGGKGQLAAARAALDDHGIGQIDIVGLAKGRPGKDGDTAERSPERVFVVDRKDPVVLRQNSAALFLLTRARDEAHRFAITAQRRSRKKAVSRSRLEDIPGIGPKKARLLLREFGSLKQVGLATEEALAKLVGKSSATKLRLHFEAAAPPTKSATEPSS